VFSFIAKITNFFVMTSNNDVLMRSQFEKYAFLHRIFFLVISLQYEYMQKYVTAVGSKLL